MENAKQKRTVFRRAFTVCANDLEAKIEQHDRISIGALLEKLRVHHERLEEINNTILTLWFDTEDRADMESDLDATEEYEKRWYLLKYEAEALLRTETPESSKQSTIKNCDDGSDSSGRRRRLLKLPRFELPTFDGHVKNWIGFWAQFHKIHHDDELSDDDKMHYLVQSMQKGSVAKEMVDSFPPCGKNYEKALGQLKQRFAKEEFIIDYYVRELLQLVIGRNATKLPVTVLYDKIMMQLLALESLGLTQDKYAAFLYPLVESALPDDVIKAWNRSHFHKEKQEKALSKLLDFLRVEVESEERIHAAHFNSPQNSTTQMAYEMSIPSTASCLTTSEKKVDKTCDKNETCIWCSKSFHASSECTVAMKMNIEQRKEFLKQNRACLICLKKGHIAKTCRKYPKCVVCGRRHYTLLCADIPLLSPTSKATPEKEPEKPQGSVLSQSEPKNEVRTVLLQTLKVKIRHGDMEITTRALLDSGAQRTFIKTDLAERLKLIPVGEKSLSHNLFGGTCTKKRSYRMFNINVSSLDGSYSYELQALEQPQLCGYLPRLKQESIINDFRKIGIVLSDCIDDNSEVCLLIGSDVLGTLLTGRLERVDELVAMETKLGWTVQGPTFGMYSCNSDQMYTLHASCDYNNVEDFWKLETLGIKDEAEVRSRQATDSEVQKFFKSTVCRDSENRYEVRLPWKSKCLESNYDLALKRLKSTTSRLSRLGIIDDYGEVFKEWIDSGIIEPVENDNSDIGHYLPHHAVIKEASVTTKIRPVFDASATDRNGYSINSCLETGINLIELIPRLLTQFRKGKIGITADIKKAFLQISLHADDRDYLKFLWWRDVNESPRVLQTFRHKRVVFGITTSPYLLSATILHHLENYNCDTADILRKSFYVDNCVVSVNSVEDMHRFIGEAKKIMLDGMFELRCWVTGPQIIDADVVCVSVLGLNWNPRRDTLNCKPPSTIPEGLSKRVLLSIAQSTFDPLGFLCPATIVPKLLIQKCWILNLGWDETLPLEIEKIAREWLRYMGILSVCEIPRRLSTNILRLSNNSLHIFCDASQSAYACCIFLRSEFENNISVQLVAAKSRVAPTKGITIPRIELLAALMASRLGSEVRSDLALSCKQHFWTDSTIVLAWLKKRTGFNMFVQNRVKEILDKTNIDDWHHIAGDLNPADLPSRGCNPKVLLESRWWEGPKNF